MELYGVYYIIYIILYIILYSRNLHLTLNCLILQHGFQRDKKQKTLHLRQH